MFFLLLLNIIIVIVENVNNYVLHFFQVSRYNNCLLITSDRHGGEYVEQRFDPFPSEQDVERVKYLIFG